MVSSFLPNWEDNLTYNYRAIPKMVNHVPSIVITSYLNSIKKTLVKHKINIKNNEPIIYTAHHGAGCNIVSDFLKSLGHNIIEVGSQNFIDSDFINSSNPNPEDPESFKIALEVASKHRSNTIIALDPDGDRFAIAIRHNKKWRYLNGNETGILLTYYLLNFKQNEQKVPIVVSTHVSNNLINKIVDEFSGIVLRTGTGFKFIAKAMDEIDDNGEFIIGFEEAIGSCTNNEIREKDGLSTAALILNMVDYYNKTLNMDLIDVLEKRIYPLYGYLYTKTISIKINGNDWKETAMRLEERAMNLRIKKVGNYDVEDILWNEEGECIEWMLNNDSWIKFRISGTEPKFKIYLNLYFDDFDIYIYEETKKKVDKIIYNIKEILKIN